MPTLCHNKISAALSSSRLGQVQVRSQVTEWTMATWAMWIRAGARQLSHCASVDSKYVEAVGRLNGLQSNAAVIQAARLFNKPRAGTLSQMLSHLGSLGLCPSDLNCLAAVHVTGSKGKGSVCSMTERILREYNLKTGFYSSPHLREVRERLRINGAPISKAQFVDIFRTVYDKLHAEGPMPAYFRFLTLMAFQLFLQEKVDVAVIEVGIGGAFDCTNVIPSPVVCGISSLVLEHTEILGSSIEEIAWQKAGIAKPSRPIFSVLQEPKAMAVLKRRTEELGCEPLRMAPALSDYSGPRLSLVGEHQKQNAELAITLAKSWLQSRGMEDDSKELSPQFLTALGDWNWPGRFQVFKRPNITYYFDGAHTPPSIENCVQWFMNLASSEATGLPKARVLMFNITGSRDPGPFMKHLLDCDFHSALFPPNLTSSSKHSPDNVNFTVSQDNMINIAQSNYKTWLQLGDHVSSPGISQAPATVDDAIRYCQTLSADRHVQVLITGSLHLVGAAMNVLDFPV